MSPLGKKKHKIAQMERDNKFGYDIKYTLDNIKRFRGFKDKTWDRLRYQE